MTVLGMWAVTVWGCRLGGAAIFLGFGGLALCSRLIADAVFRRHDLITERRPEPAERGESRRFYAAIARWGLFVWSSLVSVSGLLALAGLGDC